MTPVHGSLECEEVPEGFEDMLGVGGNFQRDAFEIRNSFKHYFISDQGNVPWQRERIYNGRRNMPQHRS
jgi:hypothetical protein